MQNILQWGQVTEKQGVIVGCDEHREWLLKWWWNHYLRMNHLPVTFFDFGMTMSARKWCEKHGKVISFTLPNNFLTKQAPFPLPLHWPKNWIDTIRSQRLIWFTKALSLLQTPYEKTLWIDLDCQCIGPVDGAFDFCDQDKGFAVALDDADTTERWKEVGFLLPNAIGYQAGVIAFVHHSQVMTEWAKHCFLYRDIEYSEQTALSHTIAKKKWDISLLPDNYNWLEPERKHAKTIIAHYGGEERKFHLIRELML